MPRIRRGSRERRQNVRVGTRVRGSAVNGQSRSPSLLIRTVPAVERYEVAINSITGHQILPKLIAADSPKKRQQIKTKQTKGRVGKGRATRGAEETGEAANESNQVESHHIPSRVTPHTLETSSWGFASHLGESRFAATRGAH